jgi:hypothetical protein
MRICFEKYDALIKLSDLKKSKHQRNKHPKEQIDRLAKIMATHGVRHPISVSKLSGEVCFGHGRWAAAKHLFSLLKSFLRISAGNMSSLSTCTAAQAQPSSLAKKQTGNAT